MSFISSQERKKKEKKVKEKQKIERENQGKRKGNAESIFSFCALNQQNINPTKKILQLQRLRDHPEYSLPAKRRRKKKSHNSRQLLKKNENLNVWIIIL